MMPKLKEKDVMRECEQLLGHRGYWFTRLHVALPFTPDGRRFSIGQKGLPDYGVFHEKYPGFLMEVKRPGGTLSQHQLFKICELQQAYRIAVAVVDSRESLEQWLNDHELKAQAA